MSRPGISYDSVKAAALELLEKGLHPSIQRVREVLGTGSNSTISEHLKRWQQEFSPAPKAILPPTVPEAVIGALEQFWRVAAEQAEAAYHDLREQAATAIAAAEHSRDEAIAELQQLGEQTTALKQQLTEVQNTAKELEKRLLVEQERRGLAEAAIEAAEQRTRQATQSAEQARLEAQAHIHTLEDSLHKAHKEAERQRIEAEQRLCYERERSEANEGRLMQIINQLRADHSHEQRLFNEERQVWKAQEATLQQELESAQNTLTASRLASAAAEERAGRMAADFDRTYKALQKMQERHLHAVRLVEVLRGKLKTVTVEHRTLKATCQQLQAELEAYAHADRQTVANNEDNKAVAHPRPKTSGR